MSYPYMNTQQKCLAGIWMFCMLGFSQSLFSQEDSQKFLNEHLQGPETERRELKQKFSKYDYSRIWLYDQNFLFGFIGNNYQRLYMRFLDIKRSPTDTFVYEVQGKSMVKNNINDFKGEIKILHVREIDVKERLENRKKGNLDVSKYRRYMILAEYVFREDSQQKYSGEFRGILKSTFYIKNDLVKFDDIFRNRRDSYHNNQFVGTWSMYGKDILKKCCLGFYRIPYCGDLDYGDGEFSPNKKYHKYGWESYSKAAFYGDKAAIKEEERIWWKWDTHFILSWNFHKWKFIASRMAIYFDYSLKDSDPSW